jgi:hypothetical protein
MAFNNVGPQTWMDEGAQVMWWYVINDSANAGAQYANADITISDPANPGAIVVADQQGKQVFFDGSTWRTTYYVRFTNLGPGAANFNLQGGGLV